MLRIVPFLEKFISDNDSYEIILEHLTSIHLKHYQVKLLLHDFCDECIEDIFISLYLDIMKSF